MSERGWLERRRGGLLWAVLCLLSRCTCGDAGLGALQFVCRQSADCADGYTCQNGVCARPGGSDAGAGPDAGIDAGQSLDGGGSDSGSIDAGPFDGGRLDAGGLDAGQVVLVQKNGGSTSDAGMSFSVAFPMPNRAGDLLIYVVGAWGPTDPGVPAISDVQGNAPILIGQSGATLSGVSYAQAWLVAACDGGPNSAIVSAPISGVGRYDFDLSILEYSGTDPVAPLDGSNFPDAGAGTSISTGSINTTASNELVFSFAYDQSSYHPWMLVPGWTDEQETQNYGGEETLVCADQPAPTPGTFSNQFSYDGGNSNALHAGIFSLK